MLTWITPIEKVPREAFSKSSLNRGPGEVSHYRGPCLLLGMFAIAFFGSAFTASGGEAWMLHNSMGGGRCLDAFDSFDPDPNKELQNKTPIQLDQCWGGTMQLWSISEADPDGWREIRNIKSGRCLDADTEWHSAEWHGVKGFPPGTLFWA